MIGVRRWYVTGLDLGQKRIFRRTRAGRALLTRVALIGDGRHTATNAPKGKSGFLCAATGFLGFRRFLRGRLRVTRRLCFAFCFRRNSTAGKDSVEQFHLLQVLLRRWNDLSKIGVIVVAGTAPHLGGFPVDNRDNGVIGQAATLDAVIVNNVAQPKFIHRVGLAFLKYIKRP